MDASEQIFTKQTLGALALGVLILGGSGFYYYVLRDSLQVFSADQLKAGIEEETVIADIATHIGADADSTTLREAFPTVTPVAENPVEGMYKNPFE